ncbi:TetR/AcrR family transcriptional regulator [Rubrimonas cliftonensis]|uniref:Transcriptional regulator, TetR family n=1 Tax=Rubrimonas cliftonensis TaxID=89524 RepID=A0A1H3YHH4_9RHOB|nr:TetR/AcrR family transcriptional regulator [Rubrimonas cliftonensis]SEA11016.1 transcriptional regulator, TetR family [Rubrimonas cliftonensis]
MTPTIRTCSSGQPGRPRAFDEDAAIAAALALFWRRGYEATSLEALTAAMGLSRSSFYCCFGSKRGALTAALDAYARDSLARLAEVAGTASAPREAALAMLDALTRRGDGAQGCLMLNCATELAPHDPEIAELTQAHILKIAGLIETQLAQTGAPDPRATALALTALASGVILMRKAGVPDEAVQAALASAAPLIPG